MVLQPQVREQALALRRQRLAAVASPAPAQRCITYALIRLVCSTFHDTQATATAVEDSTILIEEAVEDRECQEIPLWLQQAHRRPHLRPTIAGATEDWIDWIPSSVEVAVAVAAVAAIADPITATLASIDKEWWTVPSIQVA